MAAPLLLNGQAHLVEVYLGKGEKKPGMCCHIQMDGKTIGGDGEEELTERGDPSDSWIQFFLGNIWGGVMTAGLTAWILGLILVVVCGGGTRFAAACVYGIFGLLIGIEYGIFKCFDILAFDRKRDRKLMWPPRFEV